MAPRALKDSVRPRRLAGVVGRPLNFTVRRAGISAVRTLATAVGLLALLNLAVYVAVAIALGGDAINGHAAAGHYYLSMHGRLTEVTQRVFQFSRWYTYLLFLHFGIAFVLQLWLWVRSRAPRTPNNRWRGP